MSVRDLALDKKARAGVNAQWGRKMAKEDALTPERKPQRRVVGNPDKTIPYRWKKGESGNPGGLPKVDRAAALCREIWEGEPEEIRKGILSQLRKGNPKMVLVTADRAFGRLPQALDVDLYASLHALTDEQLEAKIAAFLAERDKEKP